MKALTVDSKIEQFSKEKIALDAIASLKTSESLEFLKEEEIETIFDKQYWSLYQDSKPLEPLRFSNNKTQEDIVKEIVDLIGQGKKIIFLHGVCGTGKSAIALNIARALGSASVVVPIKSLQTQYEEEYMGKKYLTKSNGRKMKIAMMTGRENHDSMIVPGTSCADPYLPDTIKITEKNYEKLKEYYNENPFISSNAVPSWKELKRISIAPANPYWSPILPAEIEINQLKDATKKKYTGMYGKEFIFYHRKKGCSYYDQYLAYLNADVIIFNAAKYLAETAIGRKPQTNVEIIDEADEFLDNLSTQITLNLTRLNAALRAIVAESEQAQDSITEIAKLIQAEETNKRAIGVDENQIFHITETKIHEILTTILADKELQSEIAIDELNYANTALEAAQTFKDSFQDTYLTFKKEDDTLQAVLVTTNLAKKFESIVAGNKALVLMSGTLHTENVLKNIFGIEEYAIVEAEGIQQGAIEIYRTGKEFDCKYSNFQAKKFSRADYLHALSKVVEKAERPTLVQVNAFIDLPSEEEKNLFDISNLESREKLKEIQKEDKTGKRISVFKAGLNDVLFTTKCSRGIDFPGDTCKSVVFTKYPNPNIQDTFWKILQKTHPQYFWDFYKDKAQREFLQRMYRAIRSKDDHVYALSPDTRVLDAVKELQAESLKQ